MEWKHIDTKYPTVWMSHESGKLTLVEISTLVGKCKYQERVRLGINYISEYKKTNIDAIEIPTNNKNSGE